MGLISKGGETFKGEKLSGSHSREIPDGKTEKRNFPELEALLRKNSSRPKIFSPKLRNFFTFSVLTDRTPGDRNREILVYLAVREIPGEKRKKKNSRVQLVCD